MDRRPRKHCDNCGVDYLTEVTTARYMTVKFNTCPHCKGLKTKKVMLTVPITIKSEDPEGGMLLKWPMKF